MKVYFYFYNNGQIAGSHIDEQLAIDEARKRDGFLIDFDIPNEYNFIPAVSEPLASLVQQAIDHPESMVTRPRPLRHDPPA